MQPPKHTVGLCAQPDGQENPHHVLRWYTRSDGVSRGASPACPVCGEDGEDLCPHCGQWFCVRHSGAVTFDWAGEVRTVYVCREGFDHLADEVCA
jgi:hypothetical protein